jgi:hypothetical protein
MKTVVIPGGAGGGSKKYELVRCEVYDYANERWDGVDGEVRPVESMRPVYEREATNNALRHSETILRYERSRVLAWTWFSMLLVSWLIFFLVRMR